MHNLSSREMGRIFTAIRDKSPTERREVSRVVSARTGFEPRPERPKVRLEKRVKLVTDTHSSRMAAQLKDLERAQWKLGTGPKLVLKRKPLPPVPPKAPAPPPLLLTDQRSAGTLRRTRQTPFGPALHPRIAQIHAQTVAQMAVQFGPWHPALLRLVPSIVWSK